MNYTNDQLKQALAKMLPKEIKMERAIPSGARLYWYKNDWYRQVLDTELLHICWMVEEALIREQQLDYVGCLMDEMNLDLWGRYHPTWQQRTVALAKVKGIEL